MRLRRIVYTLQSTEAGAYVAHVESDFALGSRTIATAIVVHRAVVATCFPFAVQETARHVKRRRRSLLSLWKGSTPNFMARSRREEPRSESTASCTPRCKKCAHLKHGSSRPEQQGTGDRGKGGRSEGRAVKEPCGVRYAVIPWNLYTSKR